MTKRQNEDRRAAIVCNHIAHDGLPVLRAVRDEPEMDEDSGWQFLCGKSGHEDPNEAQVWLVQEVLEREPSLAEYVELPSGTIIARPSSDESWEFVS